MELTFVVAAFAADRRSLPLVRIPTRTRLECSYGIIPQVHSNFAANLKGAGAPLIEGPG